MTYPFPYRDNSQSRRSRLLPLPPRHSGLRPRYVVAVKREELHHLLRGLRWHLHHYVANVLMRILRPIAKTWIRYEDNSISFFADLDRARSVGRNVDASLLPAAQDVLYVDSLAE